MSKQTASSLDELLNAATAEEEQQTQQIESAPSKQELYIEHRKTVAEELSDYDERITHMLQVVLGMKPDGNPLPGFDVEEDFHPEFSEELIQRLRNANKALGTKPAEPEKKSESKKEKKRTASAREFSLDPRDWGLLQWLPAVLGVFVTLGIATATKDWFVNDWVKADDDTLITMLSVVWIVVWIGFGFFGGPALVQFVKARFGRSESD